jgi:Uma2 family endonuclease
VREYWVLDPQEKTLYAYRFDGDGIATGTGDTGISGGGGVFSIRSFRAPGIAPAGIFPGLEIDLGSVFEEEPPL